MSNYRAANNRDSLLRDLLRDYCSVYLSIDEQYDRYRRDGNISYNVLHTLIGEPMGKGVFWRLKDVAHFLFRQSTYEANVDQALAVGALVDWCIGYSFHECCKLREDAFQGQHYATRLKQLPKCEGIGELFSQDLEPLVVQTNESCQRELTRVIFVLRAGMMLLIRYLDMVNENCALARWLVMEQSNVRKAFANLYPNLLQALYGDTPERMYTLAAVDFVDCGRGEEAMNLLLLAKSKGMLDQDGYHILLSLGERKKSLGGEDSTAYFSNADL